MSEKPANPQERNDAFVVSGEALDRGVLDDALAVTDRTIRIESLSELSSRRHFMMQILLDRRSGRVTKATTDTEALRPADTEIVVAVNGIFTTRLDDQGRTIEEDLALSDVALSDENLSEKARAHLKTLMENWRESRTRYIIHP